jgi:thioesterase domain-containing protein
VDLLWEVLELSAELIERCDDRDAVLRDWFHQASAALGQVALAARGKPQNLADQVYAAVVSNSYGQFDPIVRDLGPALGPEGLAHLRLRLETLRQHSSGTATAKSQPDLIVSIAMLDIADALGDAEAYLAEYRDHSPEALTVPAIAAKVATRLTKAGRTEEALTLLQAADPTPRRRRTGAEAWCDARLDALDALGRSDEAQAQRWEFALMELSSRHLRDYLKRLPAFEDMPAEEKALDLVAEHDDLEEALWFLLHWPEPHRAARLVLATPKPLNGDRCYLLAPLAELLEKRQPLAATVCLRAMINFALKVGRSKRYIHAARHLETCHRLADAINDWGELVDHRSYVLQLRRDHDRKRGFWGEVPKTIIPEAEVGVKAVGTGVVEKGGKGRGLRDPGVADDEAGSVQPELW